MPSPSIAEQLRVIVDDLESKADFDQKDPDLISLKSRLRLRIAELEAEESKQPANEGQFCRP